MAQATSLGRDIWKYNATYLYFPITNNTLSFVLVQELDEVEKLDYFVNKVFKEAELRYYKIERLVLAVVIRENPNGHHIVVK